MKGHRTPPLASSPIKQNDVVTPNVSIPLKVADLKSEYIQQIKNLLACTQFEPGQNGFNRQKGIILEQTG